jgi:uncharacterized protein (DUF2164 family)
MKKVELKKEEQEALEREVQIFFEEEMDQTLNNLQVQLMIRFMTEKLGAHYYNQGLNDAKEFLQQEFSIVSENVLDLEASS